MHSAFSTGEQELIPLVTVSADPNSDYNQNSVNATQDKIFLLSITEACNYDYDKQCKPTKFAKAIGVGVDFMGHGQWWLRSSDYHNAAYVDGGGSVIESGVGVLWGYSAVRPVMWINLTP